MIFLNHHIASFPTTGILIYLRKRTENKQWKIQEIFYRKEQRQLILLLNHSESMAQIAILLHNTQLTWRGIMDRHHLSQPSPWNFWCTSTLGYLKQQSWSGTVVTHKQQFTFSCTFSTWWRAQKVLIDLSFGPTISQQIISTRIILIYHQIYNKPASICVTNIGDQLLDEAHHANFHGFGGSTSCCSPQNHGVNSNLLARSSWIYPVKKLLYGIVEVNVPLPVRALVHVYVLKVMIPHINTIYIYS